MQPKPFTINLLSDLNPDAVSKFLAYIQDGQVEVTPDTFRDIRRLADIWDVPSLRNQLDTFLTDLPEPGEFLIPLLHSEVDGGLATKRTCQMIRSRFLLFVNDDRLLDFPLPILNGIVNLDAQADHFDEIFGFLMRCLRRFGSTASILFRELDMTRLNYGQLRQLCDCEPTFIWFFCNKSISDVISSLTSKVLELEPFRCCWQLLDGQIGDIRRDIAQLHERIDELNGETDLRFAAMANELRIEAQEVKDAGSKLERACSDRFVAIEQRIEEHNDEVHRKLTALADQHREENQRLEVAREKREHAYNDKLIAVEKRVDDLKKEIDGRLASFGDQH
jgi:hypothetical protein